MKALFWQVKIGSFFSFYIKDFGFVRFIKVDEDMAYSALFHRTDCFLPNTDVMVSASFDLIV